MGMDIDLPKGTHAEHFPWRDKKGVQHHHIIVWGDLANECDRCGSDSAWNIPVPEGAPVVGQGQLRIEGLVRQCGACGCWHEWDWKKLSGSASDESVRKSAVEIADSAAEKQNQAIAEVRRSLRYELSEMQSRLDSLDEDEDEESVLGNDYEPGVYRCGDGSLVAWDYVPGSVAHEGFGPADTITVTGTYGK